MAWTPADGGTLVILTGDNAFGGDSIAGLGVYRTTDLGAHWTHATGVPDGVLGFKVAADQAHPGTVYAATGAGLFRSTDAGQSFTNVNLPTGDCAGKPDEPNQGLLPGEHGHRRRGPGPGERQHHGANAAPGAVLAAVGWRAGTKPNADGSLQSPGNGMYESDSGEPGSFKNLDFAGNSTPIPPDVLTQSRIGRIALGIADGADQDHRVVYALVQDAVKFNGGVVGLDANENGTTSAAQSDYLNGLWASTDFGHSWQMVEGSTAHRQRRDEQLRAGAADVQDAGADLLLPGHPGLVQPLGPARPDAVDRVRRPDAAGVRPRGALAGPRASGGLDGTPAKVGVVGRSTRARPARCSMPPTACRSVRSPTAARSRRPPRTPTSTPTCGCPTPPAAV